MLRSTLVYTPLILARSVSHCQELSRQLQLLTSSQLGVIFLDGKHVFESDAVDEAAGKEARSAVPLERAFEPAVLALLVHKHDVAFLQLQLSLALWRVRHHHAVPLAHYWPSIMLHGQERGARLPWWRCNGGGVFLTATPACSINI